MNKQAEITRLDINEPPPDYAIREVEIAGERLWRWYEGEVFTWREGAIDDAWGRYQARHDPPGMTLLGGFFCSPRTNPKAAEARAAAWAWYWRRVAVAAALERSPRFRIDHCGDCKAEHEPLAVDRCPQCGHRGSLISTWGMAQAERYRTGERYTTKTGEHDQEVGPDLWPRALTWSDEQTAEVERWLAWHTTKGQKGARNPQLPEVLRG
jgi:hypothetical protein